MRLEENDNFKVLIVNTEPSVLKITFEDLIPIHQFFDLIIAFDTRFKIFPNAVIEPWGALLANNYPRKKEFSASFVFSLGAAKMVMMGGYRERIHFLNKLDQIQIPMRAYRGKNVSADVDPGGHLPLMDGGEKDCLFESMFSVAIENEREPNWFTEKLLDCFATFTVPIYYGCQNVSDHFDPGGIIVVENSDEMVEKINNLTVVDYWRRVEAMNNNFYKSQRYWDIFLRFRRLIIRHHNLKHGIQ